MAKDTDRIDVDWHVAREGAGTTVFPLIVPVNGSPIDTETVMGCPAAMIENSCYVVTNASRDGADQRAAGRFAGNRNVHHTLRLKPGVVHGDECGSLINRLRSADLENTRHARIPLSINGRFDTSPAIRAIDHRNTHGRVRRVKKQVGLKTPVLEHANSLPIAACPRGRHVGIQELLAQPVLRRAGESPR